MRTRTGFLAWPAAASLLYLLSAASLLGGACLILAPGSGDEDRHLERGLLVGAVGLYVAALAVLSRLVTRWQRGSADVIALVVLLAVFLPALPTCFIALSQTHPMAALCLGVGVLFQTAATARALCGRVTAPWPRPVLAALGAVQLWNVLSPAVLGFAYAQNIRPAFLLDRWLPGWWCLLLGATVVVASLAAAHPRERDAARPCLRRSGLTWILALVVLAASGLHQWLLTYGMNLDLRVADHLGLAVVLLLGLDAGAKQWGIASPDRRLFATWLLGLAGILVSANGAFDSQPVLAQLPCYPPAWLALGAMGMFLLARQDGEWQGMACAALWGLGAAGTWGNTADTTGLHPVGLMAGIGLACLLFTCTTRRWEAAAVTAILASLGLLADGHLGRWLGLSPIPAALFPLAAGQVLVGMLWHRTCPRAWLLVAAVALGLAGLPGQRLDLMAGTLATTLVAAWWTRDRRLLVVAPLGFLPRLGGMLLDVVLTGGGWLAIVGAFALLAGGGWTSWLRIHRSAKVRF